jgi:hypothetical protein
MWVQEACALTVLGKLGSLRTICFFADASYLGYTSGQRNCMSKAAETHTFRKLKTPSRCRECDSYVYFQGCDCTEVRQG